MGKGPLAHIHISSTQQTLYLGPWTAENGPVRNRVCFYSKELTKIDTYEKM